MSGRGNAPGILVVTGGSGGHLYPALAYIEEMRRLYPLSRIVLAVNEKALSGPSTESLGGYDLVNVPAASYRGVRSLVSPGFWFRMIRACKEAARLLRSLDPGIVIGFGSYASFPLIWAASFQNRVSVIHEQNAVFGTANRWLAPRVTAIACSIPLEVRPHLGAKLHHTGMPLRTSISRITDRALAAMSLGLDPRKKTLLIVGGSQGALALNRVVAQLLREYDEELKDTWQFIHLAGNGAAEIGLLARGYESKIILHAFYDDMATLYSAANLVLCRAGSSTLHELAFFSKPAILVPYPHAKNHQEANADFAMNEGAAWKIRQTDLTVPGLVDKMRDAEKHPELLAHMGAVLHRRMKTDGARLLAELSHDLFSKRIACYAQV